jgi:hypothetical protein
MKVEIGPKVAQFDFWEDITRIFFTVRALILAILSPFLFSVWMSEWKKKQLINYISIFK